MIYAFMFYVSIRTRSRWSITIADDCIEHVTMPSHHITDHAYMHVCITNVNTERPVKHDDRAQTTTYNSTTVQHTTVNHRRAPLVAERARYIGSLPAAFESWRRQDEPLKERRRQRQDVDQEGVHAHSLLTGPCTQSHRCRP